MLKKIFLTLLFVVFLSSCAVQYTMKNVYTQYYNKMQVDSICSVERIPVIKSGYWHSMGIVDSDYNVIEEHTYIRNIKESKKKSTEETFVCIKLDSVYKFNKRILIKEKK